MMGARILSHGTAYTPVTSIVVVLSTLLYGIALNPARDVGGYCADDYGQSH
jgi:hypothetical protein